MRHSLLSVISCSILASTGLTLAGIARADGVVNGADLATLLTNWG